MNSFRCFFALLDFLDSKTILQLLHINDFTVIETGGMKGRKEEMTKDELLKILQKASNRQIFSEYSMTELLFLWHIL